MCFSSKYLLKALRFFFYCFSLLIQSFKSLKIFFGISIVFERRREFFQFARILKISACLEGIENLKGRKMRKFFSPHLHFFKKLILSVCHFILLCPISNEKNLSEFLKKQKLGEKFTLIICFLRGSPPLFI